MKLSDNAYTILKWICLVLLPACSVLCTAVLTLWHLANAETIAAIAGTIAAVETFGGALLGISTAEYNSSNNTEE